MNRARYILCSYVAVVTRPVQNSALALIWVQQMHWFKNPQRGRQKFLFPTYQVLCYFTRLNIYLSMVIANLLQSKSVFNTTVFAAKWTLYFLLACDKLIWFETAYKKFLRIQIFANVLTNQMTHWVGDAWGGCERNFNNTCCLIGSKNSETKLTRKHASVDGQNFTSFLFGPTALFCTGLLTTGHW